MGKNSSVYCRAGYACTSANIQAANSDINPFDGNISTSLLECGRLSCISTTITNISYVIATGLGGVSSSATINNAFYMGCYSQTACDSSIINNVKYIYATGYESLQSATITNDELTSFSIYLLGYDSGNGLTISCDNNILDLNGCNIYCYNNASCINLGSISCNCTTMILNEITSPPTNYPTTIPSSIPTGLPTSSPSSAPSGSPTRSPTTLPTALPSDLPSSLPSSVPSSIPTDFPTNLNTGSSSLVTSSDVSYLSFSCVFGCFTSTSTSGSGDTGTTYFKPESRTVIEMDIEVLLNTIDSVTMFDNDEQNISYTWTIREWNETSMEYISNFEIVVTDVGKLETSKVVYDNINNINILMYDKNNLTIINDSYGIFIMNAYFVFYPDELSTNIYSSDVISDTNINNSDGFGDDVEYTIRNQFKFYYDNSIFVSKQDSIEATSTLGLASINRTLLSSFTDCDIVIAEHEFEQVTLDVSCTIDVNTARVYLDFNNTWVNIMLDDGLFLLNEYVSIQESVENTGNALNFNSTWISVISATINTSIAIGNHSLKFVFLDELDSVSWYTNDDLMFDISLSNETMQLLYHATNYNITQVLQYVLKVFELGVEANVNSNSNSTEMFKEFGIASSAQSAYLLIEQFVTSNNNIDSNDLSNILLTEQSILLWIANYTNTVFESMGEEFLESNEMSLLLEVLSEGTGYDDSYSYESYDGSEIITILTLLEDIINSYNYDDNESIVLSSDTISSTLEILVNCIESLSYIDESVWNIDLSSDEIGDLITELVVDLGNTLLSTAVVGESYIFDYSPVMIIKYAKIDKHNYDTCQIDNNIDLSISNEILEIKSNNDENDINCIIADTKYNIYDFTNSPSSNAGTQTWQSTFLLFELVDVSQLETSDSSNTRRRGLSYSATLDNSTTYLSVCEPIILTFNRSYYTDFNETWWDNHVSQCSFYNETTENFESDGCYVLYSDDETVVVASLHLTFFGITWQDFEVDVNWEPLFIVDDLTFELLSDNPLGIIVSFSWVVFMIIGQICVLYLTHVRRNKDNKESKYHKYNLYLKNIFQCTCFRCVDFHDHYDTPLAAIESSVFVNNGNNDNEIDYLSYDNVYRYKIISDNDTEWAEKLFYLWLFVMQNNHAWFGICCRYRGTNYTSKERISILMLRMLISMSVGAVFYGSANTESRVNPYVVGFIESLVGWLPVYMISYCIKKSLPKNLPSMSEINLTLKSQESVISSTVTAIGASSCRSTSSTGDNVENENEHPLVQDKNRNKTKNKNKTGGEMKDTPTGNGDRQAAGIGGAAITVGAREEKLGGKDGGNRDVGDIEAARDRKRKKILERQFKLPSKMKYVADGIIGLLTLTCVFITSIWCVWFDLVLDTTIESPSSDCINVNLTQFYDIYNTSDILIGVNEKTWLNYSATQNAISNKLISIDEFNNETSGEYFQEFLFSFIISMVLWQPIIAFVYRVLYQNVRPYIQRQNKDKNKDKVSSGQFYFEIYKENRELNKNKENKNNNIGNSHEMTKMIQNKRSKDGETDNVVDTLQKHMS